MPSIVAASICGYPGKVKVERAVTMNLVVPVAVKNQEEKRQHTSSDLVSASDLVQMAREKSHPDKVPLPPEIDLFR